VNLSLRFDNPADLDKYPVNQDKDIETLEQAGCDMVYTGTLEQFFPEVTDVNNMELDDPGPAGRGLEGEFRANHLHGVITIVARLFKITGSCTAYFGEKDYQQCLIVNHLAKRLSGESMDINVVVCPTVREESGLAISSRNQGLSPAQRIIARKIYRALFKAKISWIGGMHAPVELEKKMRDQLRHPEISVQYAAIRDQNNWTQKTPDSAVYDARAFVAAFVGDIRLIDNLYLGKQ